MMFSEDEANGEGEYNTRAGGGAGSVQPLLLPPSNSLHFSATLLNRHPSRTQRQGGCCPEKAL